MRIGIDIGGTHTDGVLVNGARLLAAVKTPTQQDNLLESINRVLRALLAGQDSSKVQVLNLSTTLNTNAIINGTIDPVGMLVSAGPGIDPLAYTIGEYFHLIPGSIDHLGTETKKLDEAALEQALAQCNRAGLKCYAVVSKFSTRNPAPEHSMTKALEGQAAFISAGHLLSGRLNFGRRIATAYYNSAVWSKFCSFSAALLASLKGLGLTPEVNILKADGGVMPLTRAQTMPIESIFSGPAASVMGILATARPEDDFLMIDIGGTTADIALFAKGQPLLEREGIAIDGHPTLVRAIRVESIGIGGDSLINVQGQTVQTGPQRLGPPMAMGGPAPTFMDACNLLGRCAFGDVQASLAGLEQLAKQHGLTPQALAEQAIDAATNTLALKIESLVAEINSKPVYTIHEMLEDRQINPKHIVLLGGPAPLFSELLQAHTGLTCTAPPLHEICNAVGAALACSTSYLHLSADTAKGKLAVPMLDIFQGIPRKYSLEDAQNDAVSLLLGHLEQQGTDLQTHDIQIIQAESFNMVEGGYNSGRNIRVAVQVQPAVLAHIKPEAATVPLHFLP